MQDVQNYQYYDPTPGLTPEPWWRRKRVWQLTGLVIVALVVLALAATAAFNALQNRKLAQQDATQMDQAGAVAERLAARCEEGDQACLTRATADGARSTGAAQACAELEGEALTTCVTLIAQDKKDPEICKTLAGTEQQSCLDATYILAANANNDLAMCSQIATAGIKSACITQVTASAVAEGNCVEVGVDQAVCDSAAALSAAVDLGSAATCDALADEDDRYECNYRIRRTDDDRDGLVLADEVSLGLSDTIADGDGDGLIDGAEVHEHLTDPTKADTDGDSFSDGVEVDSGYDPLN